MSGESKGWVTASALRSQKAAQPWRYWEAKTGTPRVWNALHTKLHRLRDIHTETHNRDVYAAIMTTNLGTGKKGENVSRQESREERRAYVWASVGWERKYVSQSLQQLAARHTSYFSQSSLWKEASEKRLICQCFERREPERTRVG